MLEAALVLPGLALLLTSAWRAAPRAAALEPNLLLAPGIALALLSFFVYALRLQSVLRMLDLEAGIGDALRIVSFGAFCHCFVPLGAGADLGKYLKLREFAPERRARVRAAALMLEHLVGVCVLVALASACYLWLRPVTIAPAPSLPALGACALLVLAVVGVIARRSRLVTTLRQAMARLASHRRDALRALAWSVIMQLLLAAAVLLGARGLGLGVDYGIVLFVLSTANLLQAVPASLLGLGAADVAGAGLYVAAGLPLTTALALGALLYGYRLLVAILGGVWALGRAGRARPNEIGPTTEPLVGRVSTRHAPRVDTQSTAD
ncbi:MAG: lysylphosphatidylglycerol synthase domain-containing protein [Gammaproteobacteria bacterium]